MNVAYAQIEAYAKYMLKGREVLCNTLSNMLSQIKFD